MLGAMDGPVCYGCSLMSWKVLGATDGSECLRQSWVPRILLGAIADPGYHGWSWVPWTALRAQLPFAATNPLICFTVPSSRAQHPALPHAPPVLPEAPQPPGTLFTHPGHTHPFSSAKWYQARIRVMRRHTNISRPGAPARNKAKLCT